MLAAKGNDRNGGIVDMAAMADFDTPSYDQDMLDEEGFPPGAKAFHIRHCLMLSESPSMTDGNRGLWSLRIPLEHIRERVFPDMFSLAQAHKAFNPERGITNAELDVRFDMTIKAFMDLAEAANLYPYIKKAWFEFLGEQPEPGTARAE